MNDKRTSTTTTAVQISENERDLAFGAEFHYDPADPLAVTMVLESISGPVRWTFARELIAEGQVRRSVLPFTMRWLYRYELEHLLARAGFALEALYGSYELEDYSGASDRMLAVARKI